MIFCVMIAEKYSDIVYTASYKIMSSEKEYFALVKKNRKGEPFIKRIKDSNINECSRHLRANGYSILRLVSARNNHLCRNCNRLVFNNNEDLLCEGCKRLLGCSLYSEL